LTACVTRRVSDRQTDRQTESRCGQHWMAGLFVARQTSITDLCVSRRDVADDAYDTLIYSN